MATTTFHHPRCVFNNTGCICDTFSPQEMETAAQSVAALRARAGYMNADSVMGTDLITVEVGGMEGDVILTQEDAKYLHNKLADLVGLNCSTEG